MYQLYFLFYNLILIDEYFKWKKRAEDFANQDFHC